MIYIQLVKQILKYMFIMKAVSNGWRVRYIGGDKFEFITNIKNTRMDKEFSHNLQMFSRNQYLL